MLQGVLERLEDAGNHVPRFTPPRCLLERQAVGGCDACHATCPHSAITYGMPGQSIQIDPAACTGCGLCVQACPTGALEYNLEPALRSVRDQQTPPQGPPDASLTCSQSAAGGPSLTCLGRVTPALLSAAGAWGAPLTLIHGDCAECPVGAPDVPARLEDALAQTQALRSATGQRARVTVRPAEPADQRRSLAVSRRGAFSALLRSGKQHLAQSIPDRPLPFVDWSVPEERTPQEWTWRARSLKPTPPEDAAVTWAAPLVDDTCIDCPVCANVCPTEAITREVQPDGSVQLLLALAACTGCMACLRSCPPQAISAQTQWRPAAFRAPLLLREGGSVME